MPTNDNDVAKNIATMGCGTFFAVLLVSAWAWSLILNQDAAVIAGFVTALVLGMGASFYVGWRDAMRQRGLDNHGRPRP